MYPNIERRQLERYKMAGTMVSYTNNEGKRDCVPMFDISKGSVRFEMTHPVQNGDFLIISINLATGERATISGNVIWTSKPAQGSPGYAVVKFAETGKDTTINILEELKRVSTWIDTFDKEIKNH